MTSIFSDPMAEELLEFENGSRLVLKREMDVGDQEDLEKFTYRLVYPNGHSIGDSGETPEAVQSSVNAKIAQVMIKRIEVPGEPTLTAPIGIATIRKLSRDTFARVMATIDTYNPPLDQLLRKWKEPEQLAETLTEEPTPS